jgi:hypothetical protein
MIGGMVSASVFMMPKSPPWSASLEAVILVTIASADDVPKAVNLGAKIIRCVERATVEGDMFRTGGKDRRISSAATRHPELR